MSTASWTIDKLIHFQKVSYVGSTEKVDKVESKLGSIEKYSTNEQDANQDSFSNYYPKGTNLYKIPNVSVDKAIAVEIKKNEYIKANKK